MQNLEEHRNEEGRLHFFLWYPQLRQGNEWSQVSNPAVKTESNAGVIGYEVRKLFQHLNFSKLLI